MKKQLRNYKVSCIGIDDEGTPAKLTFFIYAVQGVENAIRIIRKDPPRRKMMRKENIDWETVQFSAVQCNRLGEVIEDENLKIN